MLYKIDPQSPQRPRKVVVSDSRATRPELIAGNVRVRVTGHNGQTVWFDPSSSFVFWEFNGPPRNEEKMYGFGALWWYDAPSGAVYREQERNGPTRRIPVTGSTPTVGGPCLTSITTAGGGVWVTVAPQPREAINTGATYSC